MGRGRIVVGDRNSHRSLGYAEVWAISALYIAAVILGAYQFFLLLQ
jgi:hypothetical protein